MTSVLLSQQRVSEMKRNRPPTHDQLAQVQTNKLLSLHAKKILLICGITGCEIDNSEAEEHVSLLANGGLSLLIKYANRVRDMGNILALNSGGREHIIWRRS